MKKLNTSIRTIAALSLLTLISCGENSSKLSQNDFEGSKLPPAEKEVRYNENGEAVIDLDPVADTKWSDPELQRLEDEIKSSREARVKAKLETLKDEKIEFSTPALTLKKDGTKQIDMDVTFQGDVQGITFVSPKEHERDFYFEHKAGFKERKVSLQGMCMDADEETCQQLAIQIAYVANRIKITEQFILNLTPIEIEDEKTQEEDEENQVETPAEEQKPFDEKEIENQEPELEPVSIEIEKDDSAEEVFNLNKVEIPKAATEENETFNLLGPVNTPQNTTVPTEETNPKEKKSGNYEIVVKNGVLDVEYNTEKEETKKVELKEGVELENDTEQSVDLKNIPVPTPSPLKTLSHENSEAALAVGSGQVIFPDLEKDNEPPGQTVVPDEEFNINSAESQKVEKPQEKKPENKTLLSKLRNTKYSQSRGYYAAHKSKAPGRIVNASQLSTRIKGLVANPYRREKQYASGLLISSLEYSAEEFSKKYPNSPICTNNLSRKKGGSIGKHRSHRNGLDADISYPSTANQCNKGSNFFPGWRSLARKDKKFMAKNWHLIKLLVSTNRVHGIFTQNRFVEALCKYVKKNTKTSKAERERIFKKLHHVDGHWHHYHVRMKCNKQNPGCVTQGILTGSRCN